MNGRAKPRADVLLVTVTDPETDAVHAAFAGRSGRAAERIFSDDKTYYNLGLFGGAQTFLVRSEMGSGGIGGAILTVSAAISELAPAAIIMLGIAFGLDQQRQQIGDILIARQLMLYDLQRVGTDSAGNHQVRPRGDRPACSHRLLDRFRTGRDGWGGAALHYGLVLSGEKLVDNRDFRSQLLQLEPEAIGGEMEGAGLYAAAQRARVDWILVKAICDWADGNKSQGKAGSQALAARNAAAFTLHVIEQGGLARQPGAGEARPAPSQGSAAGSLTQLRQLLTERINQQELQHLCFDIGIDYDDLPGEGRAAKIRELIGYLERRRALEKLTAWLRQNRPDIEL